MPNTMFRDVGRQNILSKLYEKLMELHALIELTTIKPLDKIRDLILVLS